jgi:iron(III) transport system permease protein
MPRVETSRQGRWLQTGLPLFGVAAGVLLIAGPFLATVVRSVLVWNGDAVGVSVGNFVGLFTDPRFAAAAVNTLIAGGCTTVLAMVLGFTLAWLVARTDMPGRSWFETGNLVPFFLSPYVGAISWIYLLAPHGGLLPWVARTYLGCSLDWLDIYSIPGVIFVLTLFYTPYVYLFVIGPLRQMDAAFEDAARVHGASFWYTLRHITVPLVLPALLSAALIVFVTSAGLFDVPLALGSPRGIKFMPTEIFSLVQYPSDFGRAASFGVVVLTVTIVLTLIQRSFIANRRFDTVTGKGYRPRQIHLRTGGRVAALTLESVYIGGAVVLPTMVLLMVAFSKLWTGHFMWRTATLGNFEYILTKYDLTRTAIVNSLILASTGATLAVAMSVLQSYYLTRGNPRRRALADALLSLPLGIPGIILGLGFLIMAIRTPLYSTLTIILIAYIARFFPFATRTVTAMFLAINPELEQSARSSGATWFQTMRLIVLPLLRPALVAAWLMLFVIFIRELGATMLLFSQGTETISVAMVILSERSSGYVAALAVIQLLLLLSAFAIFRLTRTSISKS